MTRYIIVIVTSQLRKQRSWWWIEISFFIIMAEMNSALACKYFTGVFDQVINHLLFCSTINVINYYICIQYIPRNMHTVFALLCFVVVKHWLIFPYPSGLLHWHCGNLTIAPVPAKQPWWIWINTSCEFIMNDCITTTKQSTTKPCAYFWDILYFIKPHLPPGSLFYFLPTN